MDSLSIIPFINSGTNHSLSSRRGLAGALGLSAMGMGMGEGGLEETGRVEVGELSEGGEGGEGGEGASSEFNDLEVLESEVVMQVLWQDGDGAATAVSLKSIVYSL